MFLVHNCGHKHATVHEAKVCLGLIPSEVKVHTPPPVPFKDQPGTMSSAQEKFLRSLGATSQHFVNAHGVRLSMNEASALIDDFKKGRSQVSSLLDVPQDPKLEFIKGVIDMVPEGYYASQRQEGDPITFMRISRPTKKQYAGSVKIQSAHGQAGANPRLILEAVLWPSGKWSLYRDRSIVEPLMLVMADPTGASLRYAQEIGRCCRCNAHLTDERSRYYGIGPECETYWPHVIQRVDEENQLKS